MMIFNQDIRLVNVRVRPRPPPPENKRVLSYLESTALVVSSVIMINKCRFSSEPINSRLRLVFHAGIMVAGGRSPALLLAVR